MVQALTLRIPEGEYQLLRAMAFVGDTTINQVALTAIKEMLDKGDTRQRLTLVLERAKAAAGRDVLPRNPHGRGPKPRSN